MKRSERTGHGQTRIRHDLFKLNSPVLQNDESYWKLISRTSVLFVPTVLLNYIIETKLDSLSSSRRLTRYESILLYIVASRFSS